MARTLAGVVGSAEMWAGHHGVWESGFGRLGPGGRGAFEHTLGQGMDGAPVLGRVGVV